MSTQTYVTLPGQSRREDWLRRSAWLPAFDQAIAALRLAPADALDPAERGAVTVTMRQGLGLVVVLGLAAGVIPFIANLWLAISYGTSVPLAQAARGVAELTGGYPAFLPLDIVGHTVQSLAGIQPAMPGLLAAMFSALGLWLNWPLDWVANWIVYGAAVFVVARILGSRGMLPSLFAATSFTAVPMVLTGLQPIPILGPLAAVAGLVWGALVYFRSLRYASGLDTARTLLAMLLPVAALLFLPLLALGAVGLLALFQ